jgi:FixJ family two-component response regulator
MSIPQAHRPTVIVVDDDSDLRKALRYSLEIEGFEVISCANGETLLHLVLPKTTACLVVDQRLPGMSGIEALETLRGRHVAIPAIVITSVADARLRERLLLANAQLIEKPLLNNHLTATIRDLIQAA